MYGMYGENFEFHHEYGAARVAAANCYIPFRNEVDRDPVTIDTKAGGENCIIECYTTRRFLS